MKHALTFTIAISLAACMGTAGVQYGGSATVAPPPLVDISGGVQVVADYDEPVFYSDNSYWLYRDNGWYRSNDYRGGWVLIEAPPPRIRQIERPTAYVHYHAGANMGADDEARRKHDINVQRAQQQQTEDQRKHDINVQRAQEQQTEDQRKHDINVQRQQQTEDQRKHDINVQRAQEQQTEDQRKHDINVQRAQEQQTEDQRKHDINVQRQQQTEDQRKHDINVQRQKEADEKRKQGH